MVESTFYKNTFRTIWSLAASNYFSHHHWLNDYDDILLETFSITGS